LENHSVKEGKKIAVISYIPFVGLIIAILLNKEKRNYFARFHMRQSIGLNVLYFINRFIVYGYFGNTAGDIGKVGVIVLFILGVLGALQGKEKLIPVFGAQFQEWFKNI
jgi:uncharacterized membrane protein